MARTIDTAVVVGIAVGVGVGAVVAAAAAGVVVDTVAVAHDAGAPVMNADPENPDHTALRSHSR